MTIATHNFRQGGISNKSPGSPLNEQSGETKRGGKRFGKRQDLPVSLNLTLTL